MFFSSKPLVTRKFLNLQKKLAQNPFKNNAPKLFAPSGMHLNYSNACNFHCKFCYTKSASGDNSKTKLSLSAIQSLSAQADELGIYEIDIQGGEPLLLPELFDVIQSLNPPRFYLHLTTNGWFLTQGLSDKLAQAGIDRINVSIDSPSASFHDDNRGQNGASKKAFEALEFAKNSGIKANVNVVCGHFNVSEDDFAPWIESLLEKGYGVTFNCACSVGDFKGNYSSMLNSDDCAKMAWIRGKNNRIIRDLWNFTNREDELVKGCPAVNLPYINPKGDVLPCPYIHANLGNILEQPLNEILQNGFNYKWFSTQSGQCLAGENEIFAKTYLNQETSVLNPIPVEVYMSRSEVLQNFRMQIAKSKITENQALQIDIMRERYGSEYEQVSEKIIKTAEGMGYDTVAVTTRYTLDYIKEQAFFLKNGNYGHADYEKVKEDVYNNEDVMLGFYMPGLFLAYASMLMVYSKHHLFLNSFVKRINERNLQDGAEIGFGEGFYLWELFNNALNVRSDGFDLSSHAKNFAQKLLAFAGVSQERYSLQLADVCADDGIPLKDGGKDFAVMAELIEHLPNPRTALREVNRILKIGGLLYITTVIDSNHCDHITNFKDFGEVQSLLGEFGFKILESTHYRFEDDFPKLRNKAQGLAFVCEKASLPSENLQ